MRPKSNRAGFTLVELLVVMTIIAILFALTAAAVTRALVKADETKTRNEISQLQAGVQAFKQEFQVAYLPDQIWMPPGLDPTAATNPPGDSARYISSLWPRLQGTPTTPGPLSSLNTPFQMTNRDGTKTSYTIFTYWGLQSNTPVQLYGHQSIVLFLGGVIPRDSSGNMIGGPIGFSTSPTHPMDITGQTGATNRKGPFFDGFPPPSNPPSTADRLRLLVGGNSFPSFIDVYGTQPYLYFSSKKAGNDYTYSTTNLPFTTLPFFEFVEYQNANKGIVSVRFKNANAFQILCAGRDTTFGPGGENWPGATIKYDSPGMTSQGATDQNGYDDMSNFHGTLIGVPAQ
jgi:prepilin-type N-terminal cleavage/methylation domain-containing protein